MSDDKYWTQGMEKLEQYSALIDKFVATFPDEIREPVVAMLKGKIGNQFMEAPASSRKGFHYAFPVGLVAHSLNVVTNALKLAETLAPGRWPKWKIIFCGLFHDLGKAGSVGKPYYIKNDERWKWDRGDYYSVQQEDYMPSSEKGLYILQQAAVPLDHEMYMAIRLNDGMGPPENKVYSFKEPPLSLVIHWADHWASVMEKEELK